MLLKVVPTLRSVRQALSFEVRLYALSRKSRPSPISRRRAATCRSRIAPHQYSNPSCGSACATCLAKICIYLILIGFKLLYLRSYDRTSKLSHQHRKNLVSRRPTTPSYSSLPHPFRGERHENVHTILAHRPVGDALAPGSGRSAALRRRNLGADVWKLSPVAATRPLYR